MKPQILILDIETAPNKAYVWGLWKQNVSISQLENSGYVLCWAAKWMGVNEIHFRSLYDGPSKAMLQTAWNLLDEADIVIHYNGLKFDIPILNREFVKAKMPPPSPYKQVDLLQVAKRTFRFESNKLDYVVQQLGIGAKMQHEGFELWIKCMDKLHPGYAKAWVKMERYNKRDVKLSEKLYKRLRPWITGHPNISAFQQAFGCPKCGGKRLHKHDKRMLAQIRLYQRYRCLACGAVFRDNQPIKYAKADRKRGMNA